MNNRFSTLCSYAAAVIILFSSLVLMGCPKKISPIEGSSGIAGEEGSETAPGGDERAAETQRPPDAPREEAAREDSSQPEERLPPLARSESEGDRREAGAPGEGGEAGPLQDIFFEFDQWVIRPEARAVLEQNARWLEANPNAAVQIEGHTDERGSEEYNLALGERRAKSAMNFLVNLGISPSRISFISFGEEKGFCNESGESCYQKNRRAHFVVQ